jgi:hypothetical protein
MTAKTQECPPPSVTGRSLLSNRQFNAPPGWPTPPTGWVPDAQWRPDPSWPAAPVGWPWWKSDAPTAFDPYATPQGAPAAFDVTPPPLWGADVQSSQGPAWSLTPPSPPRSKSARIVRTVLIVLAPLAPLFFIGLVIGVTISPANYPTKFAYDQAINDTLATVKVLTVLVFLVVYAFLARKVSFRWFDTFLQIIPVYGVIWQIRIAYRLAYLPQQDWTPRGDASTSRRVRGGA